MDLMSMFFHFKGVLAEILEPIMGKGLIPADPETWSVRRRQIVPAFHKVRRHPYVHHLLLGIHAHIFLDLLFAGLVGVHGWTFRVLQQAVN